MMISDKLMERQRREADDMLQNFTALSTDSQQIQSYTTLDKK